jgi:AAA domain
MAPQQSNDHAKGTRIGAMSPLQESPSSNGYHAGLSPEDMRRLVWHDTDAAFVNRIIGILHDDPYGTQLLYIPAYQERYAAIKQSNRPLYMGKLYRAVRLALAHDAANWDHEVDVFVYHDERLLTVPLSSIPEQDVSWLWEPYIPLRKLTLVEGDPEAGKTYLLLALAAAVTRGYALPDQYGKVARPTGEPSNVLYLTAEDGLADTIKKRAVKCEADQDRIFVVPNAEMFPEDMTPFSLARPHLLSQAIAQRQPTLVILDPLTAFLGADVDMHRANEVRPVMSTLVAMAIKYDCAIVAIRHWTKVVGGRANYRGQGNIDFLAAARSVLAVGVSPEDERMRIMAQAKNSMCERGSSLVFTISDDGMQWCGTSTLSADELSAAQPQRHKHQRQDAMRWLKDYLQKGPQPSLDVIAAAHVVGINEKALRRAKEHLGVLAAKEGNTWFWRLPKFQPWDRYAGMEDDD